MIQTWALGNRGTLRQIYTFMTGDAMFGANGMKALKIATGNDILKILKESNDSALRKSVCTAITH